MILPMKEKRNFIKEFFTYTSILSNVDMWSIFDTDFHAKFRNCTVNLVVNYKIDSVSELQVVTM